MARPSSKIDWTFGNPNQATVSVEPSDGKKEAGFSPNERPPAEYFNWLFQNIQEWIDFLEAEVDAALAARTLFDAVVGAGGTHETLQELMNDPETAAGNIKNVLVATPETLNSTVTLGQNDMSFHFKPQAAVYKGSGLTKGLVIDAERVRILQGRFGNFAATGDIAIELTANAKFCMVTECYFINNDTDVKDVEINNANMIANNIDEV